MISLSKNGRYLITGGSGYLGKALIKRLIDNGYTKIRVLARNEANLIQLKDEFPCIEIITGDVADYQDLEKAYQGIYGIFHLAAFKHIGLAEENVKTCVESNILGTLNLLKLSMKYPPHFIIGISTDKAAQVSGVYGASKLLMERLFGEFSRINAYTFYRIVRYGNVLYSTGSVLCKWKEKIINNEELTITEPHATRFYWTVDQAIDLIFECLEKAKHCYPYCPKMKSVILQDLLDMMIIKYNPRYDRSKIKEIGLQPGENLHETLDSNTYSNRVEHYSQEEIYKMI